MTKDDDFAAASGRPLPKRVVAVGRKTAPAGTPVNKLPADVAPGALNPTSSHPPAGAQNTITPPRTVGGHTARLVRGEDADLDAPDVIEGPRPRVKDRAAQARAAAIGAVDDDDETIARIAAKAKPAPVAARGGTMRMDASDRPGAPAVASARKPPPAAPGPPPPLPVFAFDTIDEEEVPSTSRGGAGRDLHEPAPAPRPAPAVAAPLAMPVFAPVPALIVAPVIAPVIAAAPAPVAAPTPPVASAPTGEISISGSEFEATALPPEEVESRWPFAFAVGAVSLAIGSLIPLPFRQYIVPDRDRGPVAVASASALPVASTPPSAAVADVHPTPPRTATPVLPSALAAVPTIAATPASGGARPPAFGSVKIPRPVPGTSTTPKDVF
jgi:hypothetical protein